jgi:hypothetical protein
LGEEAKGFQVVGIFMGVPISLRRWTGVVIGLSLHRRFLGLPGCGVKHPLDASRAAAEKVEVKGNHYVIVIGIPLATQLLGNCYGSDL